MKTIFAVDDSDTNLAMVVRALKGIYSVLTMPSAAKMFMLLEKITPSLILLDIEMPEMNGLEALQRLKSNSLYADIPVMFLTGQNDVAIEAQGFELGIVDYVRKPFSPSVLLSRMKVHLEIHTKMTGSNRLKNGLVHVLTNEVENRGRITGGSMENTKAHIMILLQAMRDQGVYAGEIEDWDFDIAGSAARLHDIGKVSILDSILNKPSRLTGEEFEVIKSHVTEGERIIDSVIRQTGDMEFLYHAKKFTAWHHERWDGTGYPRGLKGTDILLHGRIMAPVDVYGALTSARSYREALSEDQAANTIMGEAGKYFDPKIIDVFSGVKNLFREVSVCQNQ